MKALFIGGTGTISSAITRLVAQSQGWELYLLNRGSSLIRNLTNGAIGLSPLWRMPKSSLFEQTFEQFLGNVACGCGCCSLCCLAKDCSCC